jgi:hypothetical protein
VEADLLYYCQSRGGTADVGRRRYRFASGTARYTELPIRMSLRDMILSVSGNRYDGVVYSGHAGNEFLPPRRQVISPSSRRFVDWQIFSNDPLFLRMALLTGFRWCRAGHSALRGVARCRPDRSAARFFRSVQSARL